MPDFTDSRFNWTILCRCRKKLYR